MAFNKLLDYVVRELPGTGLRPDDSSPSLASSKFSSLAVP